MDATDGKKDGSTRPRKLADREGDLEELVGWLCGIYLFAVRGRGQEELPIARGGGKPKAANGVKQPGSDLGLDRRPPQPFPTTTTTVFPTTTQTTFRHRWTHSPSAMPPPPPASPSWALSCAVDLAVPLSHTPLHPTTTPPPETPPLRSPQVLTTLQAIAAAQLLPRQTSRRRSLNRTQHQGFLRCFVGDVLQAPLPPLPPLRSPP